MSRLAGIATLCGAAICGTGACAQPAAAERPLGRAMARAASALAAIIHGDARKVARARTTGAVLATRCCSTRALSVYYRAGPWSYLPWYGAYELKLETKRHFLGSVTVSYFPTAASWHYGAPTQGEGPSYSFTIDSPDGHRGWRFSALDGFFGCGEPPPQIGGCEGFSQALGFDERQGTTREFAALFEQAIVVVRKAQRHAPISGENLFSVTPRTRS